MTTHTMGVLGIVAMGLVSLPAFAGGPDKPIVTADRLVGEWYAELTRTESDYLIVLTFRANGICRFDTLNKNDRKRKEIPEERLANQVGLWKLDGQDLVINFERWNQTEQRPYQTENRWRLEKLTDKELFYQVVLPDVAPEKQSRPIWCRRFAGWDKAK